MISQKEFYKLYNKNSPRNKNRNIGPIDAKLFLRDMSLPVAYVMAKHNVNANIITFLFFVISFIGNALFIIPTFYTFLIMVILHEISQILDCVDGQLARYRGEYSKYGELYDEFAHTLTGMSFMMAFGIRLYLETGQIIFLILGGIGMGARAFDILEKHTTKTIIENEYSNKLKPIIKKLYFIYVFDEVRLFAMVTLAVYIVQLLFFEINLVAFIFIGYVLFAFLDRIVYKFALVIKKSFAVEKKEWKGWE